MSSPYGQALMAKLPQTATYADFAKAQGLYQGVPVTTQGLSSEGKYGGYYTASDLETAIVGEATARNEQALDYAQSLRDLATKRTGNIRRTYASQLDALQRGADLTPKDMFGGYFRGDDAVKAQQLEEYQQEKLGEVGETYGTASMIEQTPMSEYARAIATQRYGMNPALAAGTFGSKFDIETAQDLRDQYYYDTTGDLGYQDYVARLAREQSQADRKEQAFRQSIADAVKSQNPYALYDVMDDSQEARDLYYNQLVSKELGMDAARLFRSAQVTPEQGYALTQQRVRISEDGATANFAELADQAAAQIANDDEASAFATANQLIFSEDEDTRMFGRLLATYVDNLVRAAGKTGRGLYQYQQASDILGP